MLELEKTTGLRPEALAEVERIREAAGGLLSAPSLLEAARDVTSPLHVYFEWDDSEAARKYRLIQARCLIRVVVTRMVPDSPPIRAYVSLKDERGEGVYRLTADVIQSDQDRLLADCKRDLDTFERRYSAVLQATGAGQLVTKVKKKLSKKGK